ncbi:MAG: DUF512 domain-containing protein [Candidatus Promineifilaceae bacterium]|nr:DUF512 domain-containing protein [Candidatus Promineifilaceae bacterium]
MPLFNEIDLDSFTGGKVTGILPGSVAAEIKMQPDDELLAINGHAVQDVIDVQYHGAEEFLELLVRRDGELFLFETGRDYNQELGLEFSHPTFDIDIRRCNNLCEFCFVLQMAPRFRRTLYIKDDDYRYSFLFGHYVTLTNLTEHDWWRIETMRLSPLYVSVHVTDLEKRRRFLRNPDAEDILPQLRRLTEKGIEVHTQLVIVPEINDGRWLLQSLSDLAELWPGVRSVTVVPVGLTVHHKYNQRTHTQEEARHLVDSIESMQPDFRENFGNNFVYLTDEWYLVAGRDMPKLEAYDNQNLHENGLGMVRYFLDEWESVKVEIERWYQENQSESNVAGMDRRQFTFKKITLVTGTLFAPVLEQTAAELSRLISAEIDVHNVSNKRLGKTITVAGLLMGEDVLDYLDGAICGDLIVLPRIMFDHPDTITLDNISPQAMSNQLKRPVALADTMGDVWDALIGDSHVLFVPEG